MEAPTPGAPQVNGNHLSTLNGYRTGHHMAYNGDGVLLVTLKHGVVEGPIFFLIP